MRLSRISQAVNFTLDPDDILELIYTQTSRVIDTRNFYIALADPKRGTMRFAFYVEGNERLYPDDEWPIETGLSGEIMRRGQPIITDDYVKECEKRGLNAGGKPGRAWMGVPLNAGNVPMGIMVVSDFREEVAYSPEQLQIFAAIADQAASVLDKGRLYRETAERARQLAVLNEVGSSITSTLDLRTVLTTIVSKAMELLNAEAGSLLLVDEQHNELVFEVTLGPAAPDLRGQRLPMNKGIVGAAAQTRRPQIVNEAQQDSRWLRDVDKSTAFSTRALLAVPMIVKDKVTGVIELINKRGTDSFTEDDQNLLTAFAVECRGRRRQRPLVHHDRSGVGLAPGRIEHAAGNRSAVEHLARHQARDGTDAGLGPARHRRQSRIDRADQSGRQHAGLDGDAQLHLRAAVAAAGQGPGRARRAHGTTGAGQRCQPGSALHRRLPGYPGAD